MKETDHKIFVTQPTLPNLDEFVGALTQIWGSKRITNIGQFHQEFEKQLTVYLGVKYISLFANGTLALMTAIQALGLVGEVITTPYSFVATAHSLWWNKIKPVFVDVDPVYGNLDSDKIEKAITEKTTAILPVHVYGNPCEHDKIKAIADKHNLKLIYDAAHAFRVEENGNSILNYGDLSILSFHATKVFNTIEGGAIICHDEQTKQQIDYLKNFGFAGETSIVAPGINAKMNELQAAYGILQLKAFKDHVKKRQEISFKYRELLKNIKGIRCLEDVDHVSHNYSYFPIFVDKNYLLTRDELYHKLKDNNIFGRRYFYPLISDLSIYKALPSAKHSNLTKAKKMAEQVICLPIYPELEHIYTKKIVSIIIDNYNDKKLSTNLSHFY